MDIEFVRENYQRMPDAELIRIATGDAAGLTPEAQEIVREEVRKRGLDKAIIRGVEAQNRSYTAAEIDEYCALIRGLDCPVCGATDVWLNGTMTVEVVSIIFVTLSTKKIKIACPGCLAKANKSALVKSAVLGWWGLPWGIVRTIDAIAKNIRYKKVGRAEAPNNFLRGFVVARIGQIETYKDDDEKLRGVISSDLS